MRWNVLYLLFSVAACGWGQGGNGIICDATLTVTPTVRSEDLAALVGDILINCSGVAPVAVGQNIPQYNVTVTLPHTTITSPFVKLPNGFQVPDALLLIDDPTKPNICLNPAGCPAVANSQGDLPNNVFVGTVNVNSVIFQGIPFDPPTATRSRSYRITNIRANASQFAAYSGTPSQMTANVSITPSQPGTGQPVTINGPVVVGNLLGPSSFLLTAVPLNAALSSKGTIVNATSPSALPSFTFNTLELFPFALRTSESYTDPTNRPPNTEGGYQPDPTLSFGHATNGTSFDCEVQGLPGLTLSMVNQGTIQDSTKNVVGLFSVTFPGETPGGTLISPPLGPDGFFHFNLTVKTLTGTDSSSNLFSMTFGASLGGTPDASRLPFTGNGSCELDWYKAADAGASSPLPSVSFASQSATAPLFDPADSLGNPRPSFPVFTIGKGGTSPLTAQSKTLGPHLLPSPFRRPHFRADTSHDVAPSFPANLVTPPTANVGILTNAFPFGHLSMTKDPAATWLNVQLSGTTTPTWATFTVDPNATVVNPSTTVTFTSSDAPASVATATVTVNLSTDPVPWFTKWGFASAASYVNNVAAPGEEFVIFGANFGPLQIAGPQLDANGRAVNILANTQVMFDNNPVPLYYVVNPDGNAVITGFAPFSLDGKTSTQVQIVSNGVASPAVTLPVVSSLPALYTANASGGGQGAILNGDGSVNSDANRASVGDVIVIYGNAGGQTNPPGRDGALTGIGAPVPVLNLPVKVFIDGILATDVPYAGPAPSLVEGIFQVNVRVPAGVRHNADVPVVVQIGNNPSQPGVTVAIN